MAEHCKIAIRAVLTHIDTNPQGNTTCAVRLRWLEKIHGRLSNDVRCELRDFNHLYVLLQRALQNPNNLQASPAGVDFENEMYRLFAEGSRMFTLGYLASIGYPSSLVLEAIESSHVQGGRSAHRTGKRKAASPLSEKVDLPSAKRAKLRIARPSHGILGLSLSSGAKEAPPKTSRAQAVATAPLAHPAYPVRPHAIDDNASRKIDNDFVDIDMLVEKLALRVLPSQERARMAQLTTKPTPELERLYIAALGTPDWKLTAVKLQSSHALPAQEFLRCILWLFLSLNILNLQGAIAMTKNMPRDAHLKPVVETMGLDYHEVLRNATMNRLEHKKLHDTVITVHRSDIFARRLIWVLEAHLPQALNRVSTFKLKHLARDLCLASLKLRRRLDNVEQDFFFRWYSNGTGASFVETEMQHIPGSSDSMVAFTVAPGFWRRLHGEEVVVCKAAVRSTMDSEWA